MRWATIRPMSDANALPGPHLDAHAGDVRPDTWSRWLLQGRYGDDDLLARQMAPALLALADRVLDLAAPRAGDTLLDVGTGDGLVALRAIARVGPGLQAWLSDISPALLQEAESRAHSLGVHAQCRFLCADAGSLVDVPDASVDIVTTRSVLAYVGDKPGALAEFFRVLRPGGRLALAEPLMRDEALEAVALRQHADSPAHGPEHDILRLLSRWKSAQYPDSLERLQAHPMTSYTARDLYGWAAQAGLDGLHVEHHIDQRVTPAMDWATFCARVPHPWAPSLAEILARDFAPEDAQRLEAHLRPQVEGGPATTTEQMVFVSAHKPFRAEQAS